MLQAMAAHNEWPGTCEQAGSTARAWAGDKCMSRRHWQHARGATGAWSIKRTQVPLRGQVAFACLACVSLRLAAMHAHPLLNPRERCQGSSQGLGLPWLDPCRRWRRRCLMLLLVPLLLVLLQLLLAQESSLGNSQALLRCLQPLPQGGGLVLRLCSAALCSPQLALHVPQPCAQTCQGSSILLAPVCRSRLGCCCLSLCLLHGTRQLPHPAGGHLGLLARLLQLLMSLLKLFLAFRSRPLRRHRPPRCCLQQQVLLVQRLVELLRMGARGSSSGVGILQQLLQGRRAALPLPLSCSGCCC